MKDVHERYASSAVFTGNDGSEISGRQSGKNRRLAVIRRKQTSRLNLVLLIGGLRVSDAGKEHRC
jgi:hypothetical protein